MGFWDTILRILNKKDTKETSEDRIDQLFATSIQYQDCLEKRTEIDSKEVRSIIRSELGQTTTVKVMDNANLLVDEKWLKELNENICKVHDIKYVPDMLNSKKKVFDCNSFALLQVALCACAEGQIQIGYAEGNHRKTNARHAYCVIINTDKKVRILEPQSNKFYDPDDFDYITDYVLI